MDLQISSETRHLTVDGDIGMEEQEGRNLSRKNILWKAALRVCFGTELAMSSFWDAALRLQCIVMLALMNLLVRHLSKPVHIV
jgi:hypothetical protein